MNNFYCIYNFEDDSLQINVGFSTPTLTRTTEKPSAAGASTATLNAEIANGWISLGKKD